MNFTTATETKREMAIVQKIAIPPPKGMMDLWNLSATGLATKPIFILTLPVIAVMTAESRKAAAKIAIANII